MATVYVDEDFPKQVVNHLRDLGHDMLTAFEAGEANLGFLDDRVMRYARKSGRIVLTHNWNHFERCHKDNPGHHGIIICTRDEDYEALAHRIHSVLATNHDLGRELIKVIRPNPSRKRV